MRKVRLRTHKGACKLLRNRSQSLHMSVNWKQISLQELARMFCKLCQLTVKKSFCKDFRFFPPPCPSYLNFTEKSCKDSESFWTTYAPCYNSTDDIVSLLRWCVGLSKSRLLWSWLWWPSVLFINNLENLQKSLDSQSELTVVFKPV